MARRSNNSTRRRRTAQLLGQAAQAPLPNRAAARGVPAEAHRADNQQLSRWGHDGGCAGRRSGGDEPEPFLFSKQAVKRPGKEGRVPGRGARRRRIFKTRRPGRPCWSSARRAASPHLQRGMSASEVQVAGMHRSRAGQRHGGCAEDGATTAAGQQWTKI